MIRVRTGDRAIIAGCVAIACYERLVRDDDDLISRRVAAYRRTRLGRLITDAVILATALHLTELCAPEYDVYHHAIGHFRPRTALN